MSKIVQNGLNNTYRSLLRGMGVWDKKFFKDFFPALLQNKTSILMKLSLRNETTKKEIGMRNSHFLAKSSFGGFPEKVEKRCFQLVGEIKDEDYICIDEVDVAKPSAKLMEGIHKVQDSSKKQTVNGFLFHGVSIREIPVIMQQEDIKNRFKAEYFGEIVTRLLRYTKKKGTLVFDAGYDGKAYIEFLRETGTHFIVRAKRERWLYSSNGKKVSKMKDMGEGVHKVHLKQDDKTLTEVYLYVKKFEGYKDPMRMYADTDNRDVQEYKKRWEIECIFKAMKQEYQMEKIQVQSLQVLQNIVSTIQMAVAFAHDMYGIQIHHKGRSFFQCGTALRNRFKKFAKWQSLTENRNCYIKFISHVIQGMYKHKNRRSKRSPTSKPLEFPQQSLF